MFRFPAFKAFVDPPAIIVSDFNDIFQFSVDDSVKRFLVYSVGSTVFNAIAVISVADIFKSIGLIAPPAYFTGKGGTAVSIMITAIVIETILVISDPPFKHNNYHNHPPKSR